jgi:predicted nucleotidyltransferase
MSDEKTGVSISIPLPENHVFRYEAMDDILTLLYRNPHQEFTVSQLREVTGHGGKTANNSIHLLDELDLIQTNREGKKKLVSINRERINKPDDPILKIPQEEFRTPIREFVESIKEQQEDNLVGVLVFGSVGRGEADRASDIDIQVIVQEDLVQSRRVIQDVRQDIESRRFNGERYELQVLVESVESAGNYGEKLHEIFTEAVTVYSTDKLEEIRRMILNG